MTYGGKVLIGLHITKCAGTTLADYVSRTLHPKDWYLCSSQRKTALNAMVEFVPRLDHGELRFVFGHYVHESMLQVFREREQVLFTGVRDPIDRAVSDYYQINKVRAKAGNEPWTADHYLENRKDTVCVEIIRAFPTIAETVEGTLAEKAIEIIKIFDLVYGTEDFKASVTPLLNILSLDPAQMTDQNTRKEEEATDFMREQEAVIRSRAEENYANDVAFYDFIRPHIGKWRPFGDDAVARRAHFIEKMQERGHSMERIASHLAHFYAWDFKWTGFEQRLEWYLYRQKLWLDRVEKEVEKIKKSGQW